MDTTLQEILDQCRLLDITEEVLSDRTDFHFTNHDDIVEIKIEPHIDLDNQDELIYLLRQPQEEIGEGYLALTMEIDEMGDQWYLQIERNITALHENYPFVKQMMQAYVLSTEREFLIEGLPAKEYFLQREEHEVQ